MKRLFIFLVTALLSLSTICAECLTVQLYTDYENKDQGRRSVTLDPIATIEGDALTIQTALATENVEVYIRDSVGSIVYFSQSAGASRSHTFIIGTLPEGDYTLEVEIGDAFFYGYFSTDNDI